MGARLSKARKAELGPEAVAMSARGISYNQISKNLKVNRNTVSKLIEDELAERAEHRANDREKHISVLERVQREAWELYDTINDPRAQNKTTTLNIVLSAETQKVKLTGAEAPAKHEHSGNVGVVLQESTVAMLDALAEQKASVEHGS